MSRNWFQVKNAEAIFAVGRLVVNDFSKVEGGTGWAVQMAIDNNKDVVFLFEQNDRRWFKFNKEEKRFKPFHPNSIPILTKHFAGIGTRQINESGIDAIKNILFYNLEKSK